MWDSGLWSGEEGPVPSPNWATVATLGKEGSGHGFLSHLLAGYSKILCGAVGPAWAAKVSKAQGFPGGAVVRNLPANAGDTGLIPGLGRSHMPQSN